MSRTVYRALLRLTAPEEFENKSNDDNDNEYKEHYSWHLFPFRANR